MAAVRRAIGGSSMVRGGSFLDLRPIADARVLNLLPLDGFALASRVGLSEKDCTFLVVDLDDRDHQVRGEASRREETVEDMEKKASRERRGE